MGRFRRAAPFSFMLSNYPCSICGTRFSSKALLVIHADKDHRDQYNKATLEPKEMFGQQDASTPEMDAPDTKMWGCVPCQITGMSYDEAQAHKKKHDGEFTPEERKAWRDSVEDKKKYTNILQEADHLINGPRKETYGNVQESFTRISELWTVIVGYPINAKQVTLMMAALKISRQISKEQRDNLVDACGYLALYDEL